MPPTNNNPPPTISPGQEIDTGTGGFPIEGKRVTYDVGSDVGNSNPQQWSSGQINVDDAPQDISTGTKRTLASYLSKTTMGQTPSSPSSIKNAYPIDHNSSDDPAVVTLKDSNGYPTIPGGISNTKKYVPETLLSSRSDAATNLKILRGKQQANEEQKVDGHTLLKNATTRTSDTVVNPSALGGKLPPLQTTEIDDASPIKNYYGSPQLSNSVIFNRFNPEGSRYEDNGGFGSFQFASKYEMGTSAADRNMSHARLAQIGNALSIRAGLELTSTQDNNNPTDNATTAAAILPGAAQLGIMRIDRDTLTARDVLESGLDEGLDTDFLIDPAAKSWGTLNNVLDQYAGVSNFGMQLLAVALVVALGVAIALFMGLFSLGGTSNFTKVDTNQIRPYGASLHDPQRSSGGGVSEILKLIRGEISIWRMLGIRPTLAGFENCLASGALQFFAIDASATSATAIAAAVAVEGLVPASQNPGFYAVMARSFNRSFLLLSDYFTGLAKAFGSGVVAGLQQLFAIIDVLRSSKFIKFLDTFGQLGDQKINSITEYEVKGPGKKFKSNADFASNLVAGKGRINNSGTGLPALTQAKSAFKAPDLLIMPSNFIGLSNSELGVPKFHPNITKENVLEGRISSLVAGQLDFANKLLNGNYLSVSDGRIRTEDREHMESILEAEYVPFYLHDVRTNEILSFHAFLASLSDDYSASYDSMEAFGRVEPIKTYKGTTRKISFSFMLAAYSKNDFDVMWNKINKLTTMVYPQFTEGRKLVSPDGKSVVYAPFSQTISAAPMIRVRIGDLIKSNYSKFGLARLFGMYYDDTKLDNYTRSGKAPELSLDDAKEKERVRGNTFIVSPELKLGSDVFDESSVVPMQQQTYTTDPNLTLPHGYVLKLKKIIPAKEGTNDVAICTVELATGDDVVSPTPDYIKDKTYEGGEGKSPSNNILGKAFRIDAAQLQPSKETAKKIQKRIDASKPSSNISYDDQVKELMKDDVNVGNAIARSFRTVGGKGLPGFIESLAFDWYDKVTWTTDEGEGRKAPKMCKVTISFAPFHDITPGLDHKGFNRAPIYPVGPMSAKK